MSCVVHTILSYVKHKEQNSVSTNIHRRIFACGGLGRLSIEEKNEISNYLGGSGQICVILTLFYIILFERVPPQLKVGKSWIFQC